MSTFYVCATYDEYDPTTGLFNTIHDCMLWDTDILGPYNGPIYQTREECYAQSVCVQSGTTNNSCDVTILSSSIISIEPNTYVPPSFPDIVHKSNYLPADFSSIVINIKLPKVYGEGNRINNQIGDPDLVWLQYAIYDKDGNYLTPATESSEMSPWADPDWLKEGFHNLVKYYPLQMDDNYGIYLQDIDIDRVCSIKLRLYKLCSN